MFFFAKSGAFEIYRLNTMRVILKRINCNYQTSFFDYVSLKDLEVMKYVTLIVPFKWIFSVGFRSRCNILGSMGNMVVLLCHPTVFKPRSTRPLEGMLSKSKLSRGDGSWWGLSVTIWGIWNGRLFEPHRVRRNVLDPVDELVFLQFRDTRTNSGMLQRRCVG